MKTNLIKNANGEFVEYREGMDLSHTPNHAEIVRCILVQKVMQAEREFGKAPDWMRTALYHATKASGK